MQYSCEKSLRAASAVSRANVEQFPQRYVKALPGITSDMHPICFEDKEFPSFE